MLFPEKLDSNDHPDIRDLIYIQDEIFGNKNLFVPHRQLTQRILFEDMGFLYIFFLNQMISTECQTTFCLCTG